VIKNTIDPAAKAEIRCEYVGSEIPFQPKDRVRHSVLDRNPNASYIQSVEPSQQLIGVTNPRDHSIGNLRHSIHFNPFFHMGKNGHSLLQLSPTAMVDRTISMSRLVSKCLLPDTLSTAECLQAILK